MQLKLSKPLIKNIADFNSRMLNNLINNRNYLSKWKDIPMCHCCNDSVETNIYCMNDKILKKYGMFPTKYWSLMFHGNLNCCGILSWNEWKNNIINIYQPNIISSTNITIIFTNLLSFLALRIYKYKMWCSIEEKKWILIWDIM